MAKMTKEEKIREWLKVFTPVLTAIIVVVGGGFFSIHVANNIQKKTQERSGDIAIAQTVLNVLSQGDTNLYIWLPKLIGTIKDTAFKEVMEDALKGNPVVPDTIKQQVTERKVTDKAGIGDKVTFQTISNPDNTKRGVEIYFAFEDTISLRRAEKIESYLLNKNIAIKFVPIGSEWFQKDNWDPTSGIAEIRFNNSNVPYAEEIKVMLDDQATLGKFEMIRTNVGTPPYAVLIVLPDQSKKGLLPPPRIAGP